MYVFCVCVYILKILFAIRWCYLTDSLIHLYWNRVFFFFLILFFSFLWEGFRVRSEAWSQFENSMWLWEEFTDWLFITNCLNSFAYLFIQKSFGCFVWLLILQIKFTPLLFLGERVMYFSFDLFSIDIEARGQSVAAVAE